jgi:hypothetical protein
VRDILKRPNYEVDYIQKYYSNAALDEPPCVLSYLQVFVLSNGDVLTGCYPLPAVGNILKTSLREILESEAYRRQAEAMIRRECPGCTCGIESSLAMKNAVSSAFFELGRLVLVPRSSAIRGQTIKDLWQKTRLILPLRQNRTDRPTGISSGVIS